MTITTLGQFSDELRRYLHGLPESDIQSSLDFCTELVADRMEAGMTESEAVAALGAPADVAREILLDKPLPTVVSSAVKKTARQRRPWQAWELILIALGSPIWLSLLVAFAAVLLSVYIVLWSVVAALWVADASLAAVAAGCTISGIVAVGGGQMMSGLLYCGVTLLSAGLAVASFIGCLKLTVLFAKLSALFGRWVKSLFVGKGHRDVES